MQCLARVDELDQRLQAQQESEIARIEAGFRQTAEATGRPAPRPA